MSDLDTRLTRCFITTFPDLNLAQAILATVDNTPGWDSMGALTLAALIEEEFGVSFSDDVIPVLRSYADTRRALAEDHSISEAQGL